MPEDRKRFTSSGVNLAEMQKNHNRKPLLSKTLPSEAVMIAEVSDDAAACGESLERVNGHHPRQRVPGAWYRGHSKTGQGS